MREIQRPKISTKAKQLTESVIRKMTRIAGPHSAMNLAQVFPDFPCPPELKQAAFDILSPLTARGITGDS
ncbi:MULTISPECIES: hypothetical protein [Nostocaceae]|uniref:hypothetical protein n=1 Tax=Nostocaceae TaxID=1162 RepID=UPI000A7230D9|nr:MULTISPECIES: hypothetical protein [Nostocaceae]